MLGAWPCGEVGAAFADQFQRQIRSKPMNLREVDAEHRVERSTGIESGCIRLSGAVTGGPKRFDRRSTGLLQPFEHTFDLLVTCRNLCLVDFI